MKSRQIYFHRVVEAPKGDFGLTVAGMKLSSSTRAAALIGLIACCAPLVAQAQSRFPRIGPEVGYSYLLDSKARNAFGSSVTNFGVGFGSRQISPAVNGRIGLDLSILRPREDTSFGQNKALVIFAGPQFARVVGIKTVNDLTRTVPYYGASVNAVYAQVEVPGARVDGNGYGAGASLFAGAAFNRRVYIEGRLRATTKVEDYNFSTASVTVGVRF